MTTATRLDTPTANWAPITRHYQVDGGHLAVTVHSFLTATGTEVFYCDEQAIPFSLTALASFPEGTSHTQALELLGYTVVDDIGDEPEPEPSPEPTPLETSVMDMLPEPIAAMILASQGDQ